MDNLIPLEGLTPEDPRLGIPSLPSWVKEFRPHQVDAIQQVVNHLTAGVRVVFLDAPTGAGKTLIAEAVRRLIGQRTLYLCSSLTLQDQFLHDYPYAKLIKGRRNYRTLDNPSAFDLKGARRVTAAECTKADAKIPACNTCYVAPPDLNIKEDDGSAEQGTWAKHCDHCHPWQNCPYEVAKFAALKSDLVVMNTSYLLAEANFVGRFGAQYKEDFVYWNHPFVIIDEADVLEDELMRHVEFSMSERKLLKYGISRPKAKTVSSGWPDWARATHGTLSRHRDAVRAEIKREEESGNPVPIDLLKELNELNGYIFKLNSIGSSLDEGWVYTGYESDKYASVTFKPIKVDEHAPRVLWKHGKQFLCMSATLISGQSMANDLGLADHEWAEVIVPSSFPIERRPIYVMPRATMTKNTKDDAYPKMAEALTGIVSHYPTERVLVHTVSYALAEFLSEHLKAELPNRTVLTYRNSLERAVALADFRLNLGAVLLAPSFDRGVDLPDEECRVIVVAKIPFPNLGDKQVSKRLYGTSNGQQWYTVSTIRSIVQMTGRGMRHEGDWCHAYVLDSMFSKRVWKDSRSLIPAWWKEAIQWVL